MPSDAARLEALGHTDTVVEFRGHRIVVPLDVQQWPLDLIGGSRWVDAVDAVLDGRVISGLLIDDYRQLSNLMADAIGVERLQENPDAPDEWFGGLPTLVRLLTRFEVELISDLRRFWGVRYADRFTGQLSLREIWTYVRRLPVGSAIALADNGGKTVWTEEMFIWAGVFEAITGTVYEGRPLRPEELARLLEAVQAKADHVATLRERTSRYAPQAEAPPPASGGSPIAAAMAEAIANRQTEMGHTDG